MNTCVPVSPTLHIPASEMLLLIPLAPGGLVCRGFLEAYADHNVKNFISLSSPLAGQFGGTGLS